MLAAYIYLAATLPLKWGGAIMTGWQGAGKKLGKMGKKAGIFGYDTALDNPLSNKLAGGRLKGLTSAGLKKNWGDRKGRIKGRREEEAQSLGASLAETGGIGRFATGANMSQARNMRAIAVGNKRKSLEGTSRADLEAMSRREGGGLEAEAALMELASAGAISPTDKAQMANLNKYIGSNGTLQSSVFKENLNAALASDAIGSDGKTIREGAFGAAGAKKVKDLKPGMIDAMTEHGTSEQIGGVVKKWTAANIADREVDRAQLEKIRGMIQAHPEAFAGRGDLINAVNDGLNTGTQTSPPSGNDNTGGGGI